MQTPSNPFGLVYGALWEMLLAHPAIIRDVKEANRIRYDIANDRDPIKTTVGTSDLPELTIAVANLTANLHSNSDQSKIARMYSIMVSTGDYRYTEHLANIEWCILCALADWQTKISGLQWKGETFVTNFFLRTGGAGLSDALRNRNITGWSAAWQCEVEMHFRTDNLKAETKQKDNR